jgi:p-cumate 2,3-dioxygenase subunit alpha
MAGVVPPRQKLVHIDPAGRRFRVNRDAYRSAEIFAREKELIFRKCWLYVGHVSEIPEKGDYVARTVGGGDLIFMRGRSGEVGAYFNSCTHRGTRVCREKRGNTKTFSCPYHGWVFNTDGKLLSMNAKNFVDNINADGQLDLAKVPRLDHYRGFYFVNYNPGAIGLREFLAGAAEFIDSMCDQSEAGLTVLPGEHSYSINANFKYLCENSYDGYHLLPVHVSYLEFLDDRLKSAAGGGTGNGGAGNGGGGEGAAGGAGGAVNFIANLYNKQGRGRGLGNGHGALESWVPTGRPVASWIPPWGPEVKREIDAKRAWLGDRFGKERADFIADVQKNLVIFPNLVINDNVGMIVRTIEPTSPTTMRVQSWALGPKDESPALRAIRLDNFVSFLGPSGFGSADDIEMLELCQRGIERSPVQWNEMSKGMSGVPDSRVEVCGPDDEGHMRAYWTQWDAMMRGASTLEAAQVAG